MGPNKKLSRRICEQVWYLQCLVEPQGRYIIGDESSYPPRTPAVLEHVVTEA